jgi:meckelin
VVKFFITVLHVFSNICFWFLVILSGYWFVFFKMQERVFVLLPDIYTSNYTPFVILFIGVLATKLISILYKIFFEQCSFDIFLVDWEKPKRRKGFKNDD